MTQPPDRPGAVFRTLHVCTGNIARSPSAELLMRESLTAHHVASRFPVASAGTWGHEGSPIEPFAAVVLAKRGIDASPFRARSLDAGDVEAASLVLTATREHRAAVVNIVPRAVRKTFTLKEFARLCISAPAGGEPQELVDFAARNRGYTQSPIAASEDDVDDPYGAPLNIYEHRIEEIYRAVEHVVGALIRSP